MMVPGSDRKHAKRGGCRSFTLALHCATRLYILAAKGSPVTYVTCACKHCGESIDLI